ncbi:MAG: electron transport complex subunit E [Rhodocyclaceae bacterium]|jgi:electron transport complex protein RnfE|nr:electron transport complex subunit E [Rhodocyclaceae bacterium]
MEIGKLARDGLWDNNVVTGQLLAMCPTMAVTATATNGLGMGLATTAVLVASNILVASLRNFIPAEVRIPIFVVLIASLVTVVDMTINAWLHELYKVLGLFIALIVVNCAILGRAEAFASKAPVLDSAFDGLFMGLGFTLALTVIGGIREVLGSGTLFANAHLLLGPAFTFLEVELPSAGSGALLMILPPGGFLVLAGILVAKRLFDERMAARKAAASPATTPNLA